MLVNIILGLIIFVIFVAYTRRDRSFCRRWRRGPCPEHHRVRVVLQVLLLSTEASSSGDCADGGTACAVCLMEWLLQQNMYMFFATMRFSQSLSESVFVVLSEPPSRSS